MTPIRLSNLLPISFNSHHALVLLLLHLLNQWSRVCVCLISLSFALGPWLLIATLTVLPFRIHLSAPLTKKLVDCPNTPSNPLPPTLTGTIPNGVPTAYNATVPASTAVALERTTTLFNLLLTSLMSFFYFNYDVYADIPKGVGWTLLSTNVK